MWPLLAKQKLFERYLDKILYFNITIQTIDEYIEKVLVDRNNIWKNKDTQEYLQCKVSIDNFEREYSYEYHGCARHLIVTPITDNCYLSFADSLGSFSGCFLVGLAGSGCVETINDFAKAFCIFCIIYNCYDQMVYNVLDLFSQSYLVHA
ncbi:Dynein heavy chain 5, axonemal [Tritrichomonas musculus]|uniref:Dynein heavy chain 5, axonemal n=1 Tax=Tritrichomonas musculus TaxID=1915356 RepID=A0ABR2J024_9EUKA